MESAVAENADARDGENRKRDARREGAGWRELLLPQLRAPPLQPARAPLLDRPARVASLLASLGFARGVVPAVNILDRLDELEREATPPPWEHDDGPEGQWDRVYVTAERWIDASHDQLEAQADAALIALSRNHLRALIDVARAAEAYNRPFPDDEDRAKLQAALAPLLAEDEA